MKILKPKKLPVKVISVGNISLGGTGKTPAIIFFADHLIKSGKKVGIVSRGYGRKNRDIKVLINADNNSKVEHYGDEPIFLSSRLRNIPIAVGANKFNAALQLIKKNKVDVLLFDDGFQTRKIYRDLDIVLLNAYNGIKDYRMVPFGVLREPVKCIGRADFVIFTKDNLINLEERVIRSRKGGASILRNFDTFPDFLIHTFPEVELQKLDFNRKGRGFWENTNNHRPAVEKMIASLGIKCKRDFYLIRSDDFEIHGLYRLLDFYSNSHIQCLLTLYPELQLDPSKFNRVSALQERLYALCKSAFPGSEIYWNYKHPKMIFADTKKKMDKALGRVQNLELEQ